MRVSIIIPALNEASRVEAAVASALAFGAESRDVIVVDGGSTDRTIPLAIGAGAGLVIASPRGRAPQQNAGAAAAEGDLLLFLHADCRLPAHGITQATSAFERDGCVAAFFRQRIESRHPAYRIVEWGNYLRARFGKSIYGDQALILRASLFRELGGFPDVPFLEDWLFSQNLRNRGRIHAIRARVVVSPRRWEKNGLMRQTFRNWRLLDRARRGTPIDQLAVDYQNVR